MPVSREQHRFAPQPRMCRSTTRRGLMVPVELGRMTGSGFIETPYRKVEKVRVTDEMSTSHPTTDEYVKARIDDDQGSFLDEHRPRPRVTARSASSPPTRSGLHGRVAEDTPPRSSIPLDEHEPHARRRPDTDCRAVHSHNHAVRVIMERPTTAIARSRHQQRRRSSTWPATQPPGRHR